MFRIIIEGPRASGKSHFVHHTLIEAFRKEGLGMEYIEEGVPGKLILTGKPMIQVIERKIRTADAPPRS